MKNIYGLPRNANLIDLRPAGRAPNFSPIAIMFASHVVAKQVPRAEQDMYDAVPAVSSAAGWDGRQS